MDSKASRIALAVAVMIALAVYLPSLRGDFVWDDTYLVRQNPSLRTWAGIGTILHMDLWGGAGSPPTQLYHPLPMATFWLQARLGQTTVPPLRAVNLALHLAFGLLLARLIARRLDAPLAGGAAALAFLVHPSTVESVVWLTGRHDLLGALCVVGALDLWPAHGAGRPHLRALVASVLCALAFMSKEPYVVAPVLLVGYHLALVTEGRAWASRAARVALLGPFVAVGAVFLLRHALGIRSGSEQVNAPLRENAIYYATIVWHYLTQIVLLRDDITTRSFVPLDALPAMFVLAGVALATGMLAMLLRRGVPRSVWALYGWGWFLLALLPHTVSLPVIGMYGNRYAYFPLAGLVVVAAAWSTTMFAAWGARASRSGALVLGACALALTVVACVRTEQRARDFKNELRLFGYDYAHAPYDARVLYHYGTAVQHAWGCGRCEALFQQATQHNPAYGRAWRNLAGCAIDLRQFPLAVEAARGGLRVEPENPVHWYHLGAALASEGRLLEGQRALRNALRLDPGYRVAQRLMEQVEGALAVPDRPAP